LPDSGAGSRTAATSYFSRSPLLQNFTQPLQNSWWRLVLIFANKASNYYSFFKDLKEAQKVLAIAAKLGNRGSKSAITKTESGYAIWVREILCRCGQAILTFLSVSQNYFGFQYLDRTYRKNGFKAPSL